ncbi:MAG: peptidylprolyl isomerase [Alphaproteobacteria bacterium]|nr:MAG: peptidylprolyl isomerase [Alphaproteobacteria bacterium]
MAGRKKSRSKAEAASAEETRSKKGGLSRAVVWILLALVVFGLGGYGAVNFGGRIESIGKVGNTPIPIDRYARALSEEMRALQAQTGQSFTLSQLQAFGLDRQILARVVGEVALEDEAARAGISVGDAELGRQLREIAAFRGIDGNFDKQAYKFALDRLGMSAREFEEQLRAEIARSILQAAVISATPTPPVLLETLLAWLGETRDASWALIGPEDVEGEIGQPTEEDLKAYYEEHADRYTLPETKLITYAWLTPDMLMDRIEVDEAALRALYEQRRDQYVQPERRLVERLVFPDAEAAREARARLDAGEVTFEDLVAERGLKLEDIDLGDVTRADLGPAADEVFALTEPGIVGPVETPLGPALFRVNAILPAQTVSFEEAREELRREYAAEQAARLVSEQIEPISDLLAGGATLEELAQETDMELGKIEWTPDSEDGIAAHAAFREAAAAVKEGDFPEVRELDNGGIFALRLDELRPPQLQPLDEVRDQVIADWQRDLLALRMAEKAAALADAIEKGADMSALGLEVEQQTGLRRDGFVEGVPADFVRTLFSMKPGEARALRGEDAAVVLRLDAVHPADPKDPDLAAMRKDADGRYRQAIAQDILAAFTEAVQEEAGLSLDRAAINAVHARFP